MSNLIRRRVEKAGLLKRIRDWGLGALPPAAGGYEGVGAKPPAAGRFL